MGKICLSQGHLVFKTITMNKVDIAGKLEKKIEQAKQTRDELLKKRSLANDLLSKDQELKDEIKINQIKRKISRLN